MRSYALAAFMAGSVFATPVPQGLDWSVIEDPSLAAVAEPDIPVVDAKASMTTLTFEPSAAAASVSAAIAADPTDTSLRMAKRDDNSGCSVQPGDDDTADNFSTNGAYLSAANSATTPSNYDLIYHGKQASSQGVYGYMGYDILNTYDVPTCAAKCDSIIGCSSFNIYFERDPVMDTTETCTNPPSETVIKCVYYGGPVTEASATNSGQYRRDFHVVIAGSNGYVSKSIETPAGYTGPVPLGNAAINALTDCAGEYTYMGVKVFTQGAFDASLCAAACSATSAYNLMHPPTDGSPARTCQFFNTYILYKNQMAVGQYCAMYTESWPASYATNDGQYRGSDHYTIGYSYAFSNTTANADQPMGCTNPANP